MPFGPLFFPSIYAARISSRTPLKHQVCGPSSAPSQVRFFCSMNTPSDPRREENARAVAQRFSCLCNVTHLSWSKDGRHGHFCTRYNQRKVAEANTTRKQTHVPQVQSNFVPGTRYETPEANYSSSRSHSTSIYQRCNAVYQVPGTRYETSTASQAHVDI